MSLLVIDANIAFGMAASRDGARELDGLDPVAPALLWPETRSALHVAAVRGLITREAVLAIESIGPSCLWPILPILPQPRIRNTGARYKVSIG